MNPNNVVQAIRNGKCHQVYGISDFNHNASTGAEKLNPKYQQAIKGEKMLFRRTNGEFTSNADQLQRNKFA